MKKTKNKANKVIIFTVAIAMIFMIVPVTFAANPIQLIVNGEDIQPDVPPQLIDHRTMVPVRWVSEALGADVTWDSDYNRVIVDSGAGSTVPDTTTSSTIQLIVNGELVQPDVPPQLVDNRTMVPVRWVSEALGADVNWDQEKQVVNITAGASDQVVAGDGILIPNKLEEEFIWNKEDELLVFIENAGEFEKLPGMLDKILQNKLNEAFPDDNIRLVIWDVPIRTTDFVELGIAPDIYMATSNDYIDIALKKYDWDMDMTELVEQSNIDLSEVNPAAIDLVKSRSNGKLSGVPVWIGGETVLFYNKDIFDAFEQPYPTNGMTYDEIYELTQKVMGQAGTVTYKGFTQHPDQYLSGNQLGLIPFEPTNSANPSLEEIKASVNITTDDWLRLTENMHRFLMLPGNNFVSTDDFFTKGNYAMAVSSIKRLPPTLLEEGYFKESDRHFYEGWAENIQNIGVASVPILSEEDNWMYQPGVMTAHITNQSDKKEKAMEFIEWLLSDDMQLHLSRNLYKAVIESDEVIEQFGADLEKTSKIEGLGEAVYWGENASVQNYENTAWPADRFPLYFVFRQNVLQNGDAADVALKNAQERDIANWYGWLPENER